MIRAHQPRKTSLALADIITMAEWAGDLGEGIDQNTSEHDQNENQNRD